MAGLTLGTQRNLTNDMLIAGIIDSISTVNQFYQALPFKGIQGNALAYNRESSTDPKTLVDVANTAATSINKDQQTFTRHSTELTTIIGDAQVNGLIQAVGSDYNDATAVQVATKAKGVGRKYMDLMINGTVAAESEAEIAANLLNGNTGFEGLKVLAKTDAGFLASGDILDYLDEVIDSVRDKDGMVDYIMMSSAGVRKFTKGLRANGAAAFDDVKEVKMSSGGVMKVQSYRGVPIYRNDFMAADEVFAGTLDDGSLQHGISGLTAANSSGLQVQKIGARENSDAEITRVKWYCGLANFSELGLVKGSLAAE